MTRSIPAAAPVPSLKLEPIVVHNKSFALNGRNVSYRFHVDEATGDLVADHFGALVTEDPPADASPNQGGWSTQEHVRREFPDRGRGDFRTPAVRIQQTGAGGTASNGTNGVNGVNGCCTNANGTTTNGCTNGTHAVAATGHALSQFQYESHTILHGEKPGRPGMPSMFGRSADDVATLVVHMRDRHSAIQADLSYSIFPEHDAIVRSVTLVNQSTSSVLVDKLASVSVDLLSDDYDMLQLRGEWFKECTRDRRKVEYGLQGLGSATGFSSHYHNPFVALVSPTATESHGCAWGFSLVYTGSFQAEVEKSPQGLTRVLLGIHPDHLAWPLGPGESLASPECVAVFSDAGIGGMSRKFHRLYRNHLMTSRYACEERPVLLNGWEGVYFDFDQDKIHSLAKASAELGAQLFVLDDGWFGVKYPRVDDHAGLGDWEANPARFPDGLPALVNSITTQLDTVDGTKLQFGLWIEPEMVNRQSSLYEAHPDWVLHAGTYPLTETRHQLVLNLALPAVQDFVIASVSRILRSAPIHYVKWDHNRGAHESPSPHNHHAYILGLYRVFHTLTTAFPHVLWEGCASGGGRFDPGILQYFPQVWTSDNTDALDRIAIQFGTSLVYPASAMGAHIAAVPNELTRRVTPMRFRAHVAMMGGSFGLELDPDAIPADDRAQLPALIALAKKINPVVVRGDMWRLALPGESNHPAVLFIGEDGAQLVLFLFQIRATTVHNFPAVRLQGLDPSATYRLGDSGQVYSGQTLMGGGVQYKFEGDYDSRVVLIERLS